MSEKAYVAVKACGCATAAIMVWLDDTIQQRRQTAKEIGRWIRDGYSVDQRSVEWVRENIGRCVHGAKKPAPPAPASQPRLFESEPPALFESAPVPPAAHASIEFSPCKHPLISAERVAKLAPGHSLVCGDCGHVARKVDDFQEIADGAEAILANKREPVA